MRIFLSYSDLSGSVLKNIAEFLRESAEDVFVAPEALLAGDDFQSSIRESIARCDCLVVIVNDAAARSEFVRLEVETALAHNKRVLPVFLGVEPGALEGWAQERLAPLHGPICRNFTGAIRVALQNGIEDARRPAKLIAFFTLKGGTGKTTLSAAVAARLASTHRKRVLMIDTDPQRSLSELLISRARFRELSSRYETLVSIFEPRRLGEHRAEDEFDTAVLENANGDENLSEVVTSLGVAGSVQNDGIFDLVAGDYEALKYSLENVSREYMLGQFREAISQFERHYDVIVIDCNPASALLNVCALNAAQLVVAPMRPDSHSIQGAHFVLRHALKLFGLKRAPLALLPVLNAIPNNLSANQAEIIRQFNPGERVVNQDIADLLEHTAKARIPVAAGADANVIASERGVATAADVIKRSNHGTPYCKRLDELTAELIDKIEIG